MSEYNTPSRPVTYNILMCEENGCVVYVGLGHFVVMKTKIMREIKQFRKMEGVFRTGSKYKASTFKSFQYISKSFMS